MLNFPVPYPDELLYSVIARAGVRHGITSPKQLLDEVFHDRKVVATVDLPSHVQAVSGHYPAPLGLTPEALIYKHTLFPLYAPFVPEERRRKCLEMMGHKTKGAVHLALGAATSMIRQKHHFRVCPDCMEKQLTRHGEYYWARPWQVTGCGYCLKHATLSSTKDQLRNYHRHAFTALAPSITCLSDQSRPPPYDKRIEQRVRELLDLPPMSSPSFEQWSLFYKQAADDIGITRHNKVLYHELKSRVLSTWSPDKLSSLRLPITDSQTNWLRIFMRKHRKSFSYLQHIVMLEALLQPKWLFKTVISHARKKSEHTPKCTRALHTPVSSSMLKERRAIWLKLVQDMGTRAARLAGWDHVYTWLYRNDRNWLRRINWKYRKTTRSDNRRVDWPERDRQVLARLESVVHEFADKNDSPRRSRHWLLAQAGFKHMGRKLHKLPLSAAFLESHCEDVASYQIRRLNRTIDAHSNSSTLPYWKLLRHSGLSEQRMKKRTRHFLRIRGWTA